MAAEKERKPSSDPPAGAGKGDRLFSKDALARLSALNRTGLKGRLTTAAELEGGAAKPARGAGQRASKPRDLESLCPGRVVEGPEGRCYLIQRTIGEAAPDWVSMEHEYQRTFVGGGMAATLETLHKAVHPLVESGVEGIAYLDIETCGMAGMPSFLLGFLVWANGGLMLRQFLARDYSEEPAMLARSWELLAGVETVVTFNGASFDVPFIEDRAAAAGLGGRQMEAAHVDLLHEARRRWRGVLPNCRLQTLERFICGRLRRGDIPGDLIPGVYHEFVRTRDARQLEVVLRHNALDLITLAEVAVAVLQNRDGDSL